MPTGGNPIGEGEASRDRKWVRQIINRKMSQWIISGRSPLGWVGAVRLTAAARVLFLASRRQRENCQCRAGAGTTREILRSGGYRLRTVFPGLVCDFVALGCFPGDVGRGGGI
ncbi:uncharacterized protein CANTADRAFT_170124 [Suhomyces tanzawaensis NRRL Y-17324]|uniref:Uncharacterized protein n=1 Tax=Suhomyces tanzawaensis NRRL Y-17324 TaxID=984487 RepID=A0A1E4SML1_9ASCO|nr:uncharacterized protein CANTADRAFT_170124 [Suhomyces tanzawaensis NRRL Y-17324]ODV80725.1 hypothetical protein CANTADRAFT_170124 [Suhomyces tanzawaensis NRRL Y-17324]